MTKRVTCRDGGYDCDFVVQSENEAELVEMVQRHAENTHAMSVSESDVHGMAVDVWLSESDVHGMAVDVWLSESDVHGMAVDV